MNFKYSADISTFFFHVQGRRFRTSFHVQKKKTNIKSFHLNKKRTNSSYEQILENNYLFHCIRNGNTENKPTCEPTHPSKKCHEVNIRATYDNSPPLDGSGAPYCRSVFQYLTFQNLVGVPSQCILFLYTNIPRMARVLRSHFSIDHWNTLLILYIWL